MSEKLALHQRSHERRAIHDYKRTRRAAAVEILGDYFFASSGLSEDQHGPTTGTNLLNLLQNGLYLG